MTECSSAYDFVNAGVTPPEAYPVLVAHLDQPHMTNIREGIIRALTHKDAREVAFDSLVRHYHSENDENLRWVIANALSQMANFSELKHLPNIEYYRGLF